MNFVAGISILSIFARIRLPSGSGKSVEDEEDMFCCSGDALRLRFVPVSQLEEVGTWGSAGGKVGSIPRADGMFAL